MPHLHTTDEIFFNRAGLDRARTEAIVDAALAGTDDGELFLEYRQSESLTFDDGRMKSASFDTTQGFGLRGVAAEAAGYAHASELSEAAIRRAGETVKAVRAGRGGVVAAGPGGTNRTLYDDANPLASQHARALASKVKAGVWLPTSHGILRAAHCPILRTGAILDLSTVLGAEFETRAALDLVCSVPAILAEEPGTIATADVAGTYS